ncbi:cell division protein ZapA [Macrococcus equipercicus]|uniref:Cell division protein ZapA n=1 Tax=Macrococcus equipercicus TaxID=69967 RepID=A0A9Q9BS25_9STAP|nr:cell division protein ZapA [Macrococcus equipercicus]KAA1039962.1 cell division protein ZapA [Macrococcus equipercicus]UTH13104.1 cell division protein ZapA [Macrococcus equipercicus]
MGEFKNRITVSIYDQHYTIIGEDEPSHIRYVAGLVDSRIREISRYNSGLDTSRKAVLTAVNIMDDYVKLQEKYEELLAKYDSEGQGSAHD